MWLLDTGAVEADGPIISFDLDADPLLAANAEVVTLGAVVIPGGASLFEVDAKEGVVSFEVALEDESDVDVIRAAVTEGDEDAVLVDGGLSGEDRLPVIDFGVSEVVTFADVETIAPGGVESGEGEMHEVEIALVTNPSALDQAPTGIVATIEVAEIPYRILEEDASFIWETIPSDEIVEQGTVTTTGVVATLEIDGSHVDESDDDWQVYLRRVGAGLYEGQAVDRDGDGDGPRTMGGLRLQASSSVPSPSNRRVSSPVRLTGQTRR